MAADNANKLMPIFLKWGLGIVTAIAMGLATMSYNTLLTDIGELRADIKANRVENKRDMEKLESKFDKMDGKIDGMVTNSRLQGERIVTLKEDFKEHEEEGHR